MAWESINNQIWNETNLKCRGNRTEVAVERIRSLGRKWSHEDPVHFSLVDSLQMHSLTGIHYLGDVTLVEDMRVNSPRT